MTSIAKLGVAAALAAVVAGVLFFGPAFSREPAQERPRLTPAQRSELNPAPAPKAIAAPMATASSGKVDGGSEEDDIDAALFDAEDGSGS